MIRTNLAGRSLSTYDLLDTMRRAYADYEHRHDSGKHVAITTPLVATTIKGLVEKFAPGEKRDPSSELAELRSITTRWGAIRIHEDPLMPAGTILIIDEDDFPEWKERMEQGKTNFMNYSEIINIGEH